MGLRLPAGLRQVAFLFKHRTPAPSLRHAIQIHSHRLFRKALGVPPSTSLQCRRPLPTCLLVAARALVSLLPLTVCSSLALFAFAFATGLYSYTKETQKASGIRLETLFFRVRQVIVCLYHCVSWCCACLMLERCLFSRRWAYCIGRGVHDRQPRTSMTVNPGAGERRMQILNAYVYGISYHEETPKEYVMLLS